MRFFLLTDAARLKNKTQEVISGNHKIVVIADGAGDAYLDAMTLMRQGLNMECSCQFIAWTSPGVLAAGATCGVFGSLSSRDMFQRPSKWPQLVFSTPLFSLTAGDAGSVNPVIFSGFKLSFSQAGEVRFLTL
jgi:hypothetical protein